MTPAGGMLQRLRNLLPVRGGDRLRDVEVLVHTRVGCGLCRQAEELVALEARGTTIHHVDVDGDPELQERYGVRVPVVLVDGVEVAELQVAPGSVARAVRQAVRSRAARRAAHGDLPPAGRR